MSQNCSLRKGICGARDAAEKLSINEPKFSGKGMGGFMRRKMKNFWKDESGIGVVELILILVILIMIIVIFRTQITSIITSAFEQINEKAGTVNSAITIKKK